MSNILAEILNRGRVPRSTSPEQFQQRMNAAGITVVPGRLSQALVEPEAQLPPLPDITGKYFRMLAGKFKMPANDSVYDSALVPRGPVYEQNTLGTFAVNTDAPNENASDSVDEPFSTCPDQLGGAANSK